MATTRVKPLLSVVLQPDGETYCAECPELSLATEDDTPRKALNNLVELIREYAEDYQAGFEHYAKSPNRAQHWPLLKRVLACKTKREIKALLGL